MCIAQFKRFKTKILRKLSAKTRFSAIISTDETKGYINMKSYSTSWAVLIRKSYIQFHDCTLEVLNAQVRNPFGCDRQFPPRARLTDLFPECALALTFATKINAPWQNIKASLRFLTIFDVYGRRTF